jgi:anti-sigma B factor antagonist
VAVAWTTETEVREGGHAVLSVSGELDIATAGRLRGTVGDLMGQGVRHLEIDLDGCTFLDSTGMGALLWAAHRLQALGGDLTAVHAHGAPAEAMQIAGLDHVIPLRA